MNGFENTNWKDGFLHGAGVALIAIGFGLGGQRNLALAALGGLGLYLARGGSLSAESLRAPELPSMDDLRNKLPFQAQAAGPLSGLG